MLKPRDGWNKVLTTPCAEWLHCCPKTVPTPSCTPWLLSKVTLYPTRPKNSVFPFETALRQIPPGSNKLWAMAEPPCPVPVCPEIKLIPQHGEPSLGGVQGWGGGMVCRSSRRRHKGLLWCLCNTHAHVHTGLAVCSRFLQSW